MLEWCEFRGVGLVIAVGVLPASDPAPPGGDPARSPRRYDDSFRRYAVKRALESDVRVADVAGELGVSAGTLRRWVKASRDADSTKAAADGADVAAGPDAGDATVADGAAVGSMVVELPALETPNAPTLAAALALAGPPVAVPAVDTGPTTAAAPSGPEGAEEHDAPHVLAMLDAILEMFPQPAGLPLEADLTDPGPGARREAEPAADRIPLHPGDDIFPRLSTLLPAYRFPIILAGLLAALLVSTVVPADHALRPLAVSLHVLSLVVSFGAVLVIDWHGLLWLAGRRGLTESTRLAAGAGPLIWGGLAGLMATGALLHPDLSSPLTLTKMVLVLAVAWNGAAMSALRRRLAQLPAYVKPADLPRRDWRLILTATVISQVGWWGAILIGFVNSST